MDLLLKVNGHQEGGYRNHFINGFDYYTGERYHVNRLTWNDFFWSHQDRNYNNYFKQKYKWKSNNQKINTTKILADMDSTVNLILDSAPNDNSVTDDIEYLWDVLDPLYRIALLNQTQLKPFLNVIDLLTQDSQLTKWDTLISDVQTFLLNQRADVLNITFLDWSWCDANNRYAQTKMFTFLPKKIIQISPKIIDILNLIEFRTKVNITLLEQKLQERSGLANDDPNNQYIVEAFFDNFYQIFKSWFDPNSKQKAAYSVYSKAVNKINLFYKSIYLNL